MIEVIRADITTLDVDAIVNAANEELASGGGVDGAIHRAAGHRDLFGATRDLAPCPTGSAVVTPGFKLKARFVIHAVGPIWYGGTRGEAGLLRSAYEQSFARALDVNARSIAFPSISTGVYGYPKREAAVIAIGVMRAHEPELERIVACVFSVDDEELYQSLLLTSH